MQWRSAALLLKSESREVYPVLLTALNELIRLENGQRRKDVTYNRFQTMKYVIKSTIKLNSAIFFQQKKIRNPLLLHFTTH